MKELILPNDIEFESAHELTAGKFSALYESGRLRYIKYDGDEILRMIYPALRSEEWETIKGVLSDERIEADGKGFSVSFKINYDKNEIKYAADFEIKASGDTIEYIMRGVALSSFKSKRVGLCVHHPVPSCEGKKVTIKHSEERTEVYEFPELISPVWPFTDIQSMRWCAGNVDVELNFDGDLFEMEDQRNWTDDSYKTYSGPQYKTPMLDIKNGDTMQHTITLKAHEARFNFPKIGFSRGVGQGELSSQQIELLKQVPLDHYRVEIDLADNNWKGILYAAKSEARLLGSKIELVISCSSVPGEDFIEMVDDSIESILIISDIYEDVHTEIKDHFAGIPVGFSKKSWFADLNGSPLEDLHFDFTAFLVSPQVHQNDNLSIMENLGSQKTTLETLNVRTGGKAVHVSPIVFSTVKDSRMHTSFAAWWTVNTIYNFASAGYLTFYELIGSRGVLHDENNPSPLFDLFRSIKQFEPVYIFKNKNGEIVLENSNGAFFIIKQ